MTPCLETLGHETLRTSRSQRFASTQENEPRAHFVQPLSFAGRVKHYEGRIVRLCA